MYSLDDFNIPGPNAKSGKDRTLEFARFMAYVRPWIEQGGSTLDVEETLAYLGLASDAAGWRYMGELEIKLALAVGRWYGAMALGAYTGTTKECNQIVPYLCGGQPLDISDVPLNGGFQLGGTLNGQMVTHFEFTAAPGAYAALTGLGSTAIATQNAAVVAAGHLDTGREAIEVGRKRVVFRPEFFRTVLAASLRSATTRNEIPWLAGISVKLQSQQMEIGTIVGDPPRRGDIYRSGNSTLVVAGYDGTDLAVVSITNEPVAPVTYTHVDGVRSFDTMDAVSIIDYAAAEVVRNADPADATNGPTTDSPYPGLPPVTGVFSTTLYQIVEPCRLMAMGGDFLTQNPYTRTAGATRDDTRGHCARGVEFAAAWLELFGRGDVSTVIATVDAVKTSLRAASLYSSGLQITGVGSYLPFTYSAGNTLLLNVGLVAVLTDGINAAYGVVVEHDGDNTTGSGVFAALSDTNGIFKPGATLTLVVGTHSSTAAFANTAPYSLPPHIGNPNAGSSPTELTYVGELSDSFADLSTARVLMHGVAGGTLASLAAATELNPSGLAHNENMRHVFVMTALAWMDKITSDNAQDAASYPNTVADLATLGWPSWVSGSVADRADGLNLVDQTLWPKYLTDLAIVASGHRIEAAFVTAGSIQPPALGIAPIVTPGRMALTPDLAVTGEHDTSFFVSFGVPNGLASVLEAGRILIELPAGTIFTSADFPVAPNTTGTATISTDGRRLDIVFDDDGGAGYASGSIVNIVRCSIRAVRAIGDIARGVTATMRPGPGWLRDGDATELAGLMTPAVLSVVTELR